MRAPVKETFTQEHVDTLARDLAEACATLDAKGGAHQSGREKIKISRGTTDPAARPRNGSARSLSGVPE